MTPQEQQMLQDLVTRINQTVLQDKDPEAEQFLTQSLSRNPDSIYILAQTVLVQRYALDQAKKQLDEARQAAQQAPPPPPAPVHHTSFLGSLLGEKDPAPPPPQQQYNQSQYQPVNYGPPAPPYQQPQYGQPQYAQPGYGAPSGGGGFLRGAMQTAGGVAAGALAFEGIESLMHGFGEHAGYGAGSGFGNIGGMGMGQPREEVVNNYYGDSDRGGISPDIEDRRDDNSRDSFTGSRNDYYKTNDADTNTGADDYGSDDSSSDDSGSDYGSDDSSN
jgi:hypothetical protein